MSIPQETIMENQEREQKWLCDPSNSFKVKDLVPGTMFFFETKYNLVARGHGIITLVAINHPKKDGGNRFSKVSFLQSVTVYSNRDIEFMWITTLHPAPARTNQYNVPFEERDICIAVDTTNLVGILPLSWDITRFPARLGMFFGKKLTDVQKSYMSSTPDSFVISVFEPADLQEAIL